MSYNFDDLIYDTKKTIDKVANKASEAVDYSKIQLERAQLRSLLKENYAKLGKLAYQMHTSDSNESSKMKLIISDIEKLEDKLSKTVVKRAKICKFCLTKNPAENEFCSKCGEML